MIVIVMSLGWQRHDRSLQVAHSRPDAIFKEFIDIRTGPTDAQLSRLADGLGFTAPEQKSQVCLCIPVSPYL